MKQNADEAAAFGAPLLCSDICQEQNRKNIGNGRHFERALENIVHGSATLLYADWVPQWNGSPQALRSIGVNHKLCHIGAM